MAVGFLFLPSCVNRATSRSFQQPLEPPGQPWRGTSHGQGCSLRQPGNSRQRAWDHRIIEWSGLEGTLWAILFQLAAACRDPFHQPRVLHRVTESWRLEDLWDRQVQPSTQHHRAC